MNSNNNTRVNRYGALAAEIYDIDKPIGSMPDTTFYLERLVGVDGPVLEPGCGSGRTLLPLLDAGHDITGFDASADMLERCRVKCSARGYHPDLSQQQLEDFRYAKPFAAVIMPAGTFTLIDDFAAAMAVLHRIRNQLRPGGLVVLDIPSLAVLAAADLTDRRNWTAENGDLLTLDGVRVKTDWLTQRTTANLRYERWRDNVLIESHLEPMAQRHWGLEEFRLALTQIGFGDIKVIGNFDRRRAPRSSDGIFTFEAVRA